MSSNNQLIIKKEKKKYVVYHNLCVDNEFVPSKDAILKRFKILEEAIRFANKFCSENMVEYGTYIEEKTNKTNKEVKMKKEKTNKEVKMKKEKMELIENEEDGTSFYFPKFERRK